VQSLSFSPSLFVQKSKKLHTAVRRAGLRKIRFHDLRHTAASLLLANGVDVVAVSRLLGHSSPIVTLSVYSHAIPRERQGLTDTLAGLFSSKPVANLNDIATSTESANYFSCSVALVATLLPESYVSSSYVESGKIVRAARS
jgi:hypothetical protein